MLDFEHFLRKHLLFSKILFLLCFNAVGFLFALGAFLNIMQISRMNSASFDVYAPYLENPEVFIANFQPGVKFVSLWQGIASLMLVLLSISAFNFAIIKNLHAALWTHVNATLNTSSNCNAELAARLLFGFVSFSWILLVMPFLNAFCIEKDEARFSAFEWCFVVAIVCLFAYCLCGKKRGKLVAPFICLMMQFLWLFADFLVIRFPNAFFSAAPLSKNYQADVKKVLKRIPVEAHRVFVSVDNSKRFRCVSFGLARNFFVIIFQNYTSSRNSFTNTVGNLALQEAKTNSSYGFVTHLYWFIALFFMSILFNALYKCDNLQKDFGFFVKLDADNKNSSCLPQTTQDHQSAIRFEACAITRFSLVTFLMIPFFAVCFIFRNAIEHKFVLKFDALAAKLTSSTILLKMLVAESVENFENFHECSLFRLLCKAKPSYFERVECLRLKKG